MSFWQIKHSPQKEKRLLQNTLQNMTDNQKMNKTSMKHVQQQHFIQDIK